MWSFGPRVRHATISLAEAQCSVIKSSAINCLARRVGLKSRPRPQPTIRSATKSGSQSLFPHPADTTPAIDHAGSQPSSDAWLGPRHEGATSRSRVLLLVSFSDDSDPRAVFQSIIMWTWQIRMQTSWQSYVLQAYAERRQTAALYMMAQPQPPQLACQPSRSEPSSRSCSKHWAHSVRSPSEWLQWKQSKSSHVSQRCQESLTHRVQAGTPQVEQQTSSPSTRAAVVPGVIAQTTSKQQPQG